MQQLNHTEFLNNLELKQWFDNKGIVKNISIYIAPFKNSCKVLCELKMKGNKSKTIQKQFEDHTTLGHKYKRNVLEMRKE